MQIHLRILYKLSIIVLFCGLSVSQVQAMLEIKTDLSNISRDLLPSEQARLDQYIQDVHKALPHNLKKSIDRPIQVRFSVLNPEGPTRIPALRCNDLSDDEVEEHGHAHTLGLFRRNILSNLPFLRNNPYEILLDQSVWGTIISGEDLSFNCGHRSTQMMARAVLIHEIAHIFDFQNVRLGIEKKKHDQCDKLYGHREDLNNYCTRYMNRQRSISNSPLFLNLTEWTRKRLQRMNQNYALARSPDPYEYKMPEETFAVNMEFYLLDPTYPCRRPSLSRYFDSVFGEERSKKSDCDKNNTITLMSTDEIGDHLYRNLDPDLIYEIHFLFAGQGPRIMSRWGHSMLRIVMCRKGQTPGPDCVRDHSNDIVVNFRASIEDLNIDYFKGLTGKYDSIIYFQNLSSIIEEYTIGEFRELKSRRLKLSEKEKLLLLYRIKESYWAYRGKYYFISNNCASEALRVLKAAQPENLHFQGQRVLHPLGLYQLLQRQGLIEQSKITKDKELAERAGLYFPPYHHRLESSFNLVRPYFPGITFEDFLSKITAQERRNHYENLLSKDDSLSTVANLLRLEIHAERIAGLRAMRAIGAEINNYRNHNDTKFEPLEDFFNNVLKLQNSLMAENNIKNGYGIPLKDEFNRLHKDEIEYLNQELQDTMNEAEVLLSQFFHDKYQEVKNIQSNIRWLGQQL